MQDESKVVTVDERSRIRTINNMDGRQHCMGICFSASLQEEGLAFESAALRDEWVSKLTVRVCMLCARSLFHRKPLHNAQSLHVVPTAHVFQTARAPVKLNPAPLNLIPGP
jgi:hypothetical protein